MMCVFARNRPVPGVMPPGVGGRYLDSIIGAISLGVYYCDVYYRIYELGVAGQYYRRYLLLRDPLQMDHLLFFLFRRYGN
jgi:hypothetical protein